MHDERIAAKWKPTSKKVKTTLKKSVQLKRIELHQLKEQQSKLFREQEQDYHLWSMQNLNQGKTASLTVMFEQMVETKSWKARRLIDNMSYRVCYE